MGEGGDLVYITSRNEFWNGWDLSGLVGQWRWRVCSVAIVVNVCIRGIREAGTMEEWMKECSDQRGDGYV